MEDGFGTFIKIEEPTVLQSGTVVCVGESHIIVGLITEKSETDVPVNQSRKINNENGNKFSTSGSS